MPVILTTRRRFLMGLTMAAAAPMIVRASSIMPVKAMAVGDGAALYSVPHPLMTDAEVYAWFQKQAGYVAQRRGVNVRAGWNNRISLFNRDSLEDSEIELLPDVIRVAESTS